MIIKSLKVSDSKNNYLYNFEEKTMIFSTFPVTVTDTRDRRFHMIKVVFAVAEQDIEIPLYLMPNP